MKANIERVVLGCSQLGGLYRPVDEATAEATLEAAWAAGVRAFDTAPHYGAGLSERRVGKFLSQMPRETYTLSTKVGRLLVPTDDDTDGDEGFFGGDRNRRVLDYSSSGVRRSLDDSLNRLGLDRVDTLYVHDPDDHLDQAIDEALPALADLRNQGAVQHVGAGMNDDEAVARIVAETDADQIMLANRYTLLDRSGEKRLLPLCAERNVTVVVAGVYNSGLLADPKPGASYDYAEADAAIVGRAQALRDLCSEFDVPLRAAAVQFSLRRPEVTAVALGCRGPQQVTDNLTMLTWDIPQALWNALDELTLASAVTPTEKGTTR